MPFSTPYHRWHVPIPEGDFGPTDIKDEWSQMLAQSRDETWWQGGRDLQELVSVEQGSHCGIDSVRKKANHPSEQTVIIVHLWTLERWVCMTSSHMLTLRKWLSAAPSHAVKFCIIAITPQPSDLLHTIIWVPIPCNALLHDWYVQPLGQDKWSH